MIFDGYCSCCWHTSEIKLCGYIITDDGLVRLDDDDDESFSIRKSSEMADDWIEDIYIIEIKTQNKSIRNTILFWIRDWLLKEIDKWILKLNRRNILFSKVLT